MPGKEADIVGPRGSRGYSKSVTLTIEIVVRVDVNTPHEL